MCPSQLRTAPRNRTRNLFRRAFVDNEKSLEKLSNLAEVVSTVSVATAVLSFSKANEKLSDESSLPLSFLGLYWSPILTLWICVPLSVLVVVTTKWMQWDRMGI